MGRDRCEFPVPLDARISGGREEEPEKLEQRRENQADDRRVGRGHLEDEDEPPGGRVLHHYSPGIRILHPRPVLEGRPDQQLHSRLVDSQHRQLQHGQNAHRQEAHEIHDLVHRHAARSELANQIYPHCHLNSSRLTSRITATRRRIFANRLWQLRGQIPMICV